ncbi:YihY/virulence factor BrkB family protein [Candidatus Saccharibacteria bacterium]|nr:YihY/virulence factor BrkB family protein [Candidatus Saccharibacteria bacterium]
MFGFVKQVFSEYGKDKAGQLSAAFAYVAVFSIGPLLLVLVSIVGLIYGQRAAQGQLFDQLSSAVGPDTARTLQDLVAHINHAGSSVIALVLGIIGLLLAAGGLTAQLQNSFDIILRAVPDPKAGLKFSIYTKLKNILVVIIASLVAIASVVLSALITGAGKGAGLEILNTAVSLAVFIAILYLIYRFLPDVGVPRPLALKAAALVSLLFLIGKVVLGFIIGHNGTASAYGAAASLVILLLWFYYTAQILLLGAEGIKVYGENHKLDFSPKRFALKLKELDVHAKKDLRGRLLEAFARGYKSKSKR